MGRPTYQELKESILNRNLYTQTQCIGHSLGRRCMSAVPLHQVNIARERLKVDVGRINEVDVRDILSCLLCERQTCGQNHREKQLYQKLWSDELRHLDSQRHKQASRYSLANLNDQEASHRCDSPVELMRHSTGEHQRTSPQSRSNAIDDNRASDKISLGDTCLSSSPGNASTYRYSTPSLSETVSTPIDDLSDDEIKKPVRSSTPFHYPEQRSSQPPEKTTPLIWHSPSVSPLGIERPTPSHKSSLSTIHYHANSEPRTSPVLRHRASADDYNAPFPPTPHLKPSKYNLRASQPTLPTHNVTKTPSPPPRHPDNEIARARDLTKDILCGTSDNFDSAKRSSAKSTYSHVAANDRMNHVSLPTPPAAAYPRQMQRYKHFTAPSRASPVMDLDTRISDITKSPSPCAPCAPTPVPILFTVPKAAASSVSKQPPFRRTQSAPDRAITADALMKARLEELAAEARANQPDFPRIGQVWPMVAAMVRGYTGMLGESLRCFGRSEYRD